MTQNQRKLAAIFFSDMKGFSSQMDADESGTMDRLRRHNAIMSEQIDTHDGRVIKTVGDAFMAEFSSSVAAVACALDCLRAFETHNAGTSDTDAIKVRIGVHVGDVVVEGDDLFGEAVNVAARLEPQAPVGGVCVSQAVYDQVRRKVHARGEARHKVSLKGIGDEMTLYALWPSAEHLDIKGAEAVSAADGTNASRRLLIGVAIAALLASAAAMFVGVTQDVDDTPPAKVEASVDTPGAPGTHAEEAALAPGPRRGGVLTFGVPAPVYGPFDPYSRVSDLTRAIGSCVFESLVRQDSAGTYQPQTLESWNVSDDGTQVTLTLRDDLVFHPHPCFGDNDDRTATAKDLAYSVRTAVERGDLPIPIVGVAKRSEPPTNKPTGNGKGTQPATPTDSGDTDKTASPGIDVVGPHAVRVTLTHPTAYLSLALTEVIMLPEVLEGCAAPRKLAHPVSTGPFQLAAITEAGRVTLKRHDRYHLEDAQGRELPYLDGIESFTSTNAGDDLGRIARGQLHLSLVARDAAKDLLSDVEAPRPRLADSFAKAPVNVGLPTDGQASVTLILLPLGQDGRTTSPAFRQAVAMAIDRAALVEGVHELGEPLGRFLEPKAYGYDVTLESFELNVNTVKANLKKAGLTSGKALEPVTIAAPVLKEILPRLTAQLDAAGIPTKGIPVSINSAGSLIKEAKVDFLLGWMSSAASGDEPVGLARLGLSTAESIFAHDDSYHALATELLATTSREKRRELYMALERKCMDFVPYIPLATRNRNLFSAVYFYHSTLKGLFDETTQRVMREGDWMTHVWLDQKSPGAAAP